ncbi:MAG: hypothetical protein M3158_07255, partial [Pseudomonadota bacterium]|nr:hypothetical protein [Pseudomonadota bacterium]
SRNAQAAALFARALAVAPERRRELLREYADQVLYSGQPVAAIPLYEEVLQRADLPPKELRDARLGLARAYSWSNQPDLGLPFYTAILRTDPTDFEALIGRGQALNAVAAHRAALVDFEMALQLRPGNADGLRGAARAETSLGLHRVAIQRIAPLVSHGDQNPETLRIVADARRAMGRPDLSEDAALAILAVKPDDEGAQRLLAELYRERRPLSQIEATQIRRSDDLRINGVLAFTEFTFDRGLVKLAPQARHLSHRGGYFPDVDVYSIGMRGRQRFNDWLEFKTDVFVNSEEEPRDKDVTLTHETTLSFIPSDVWRVNLQAARRYPDENPISIVNDVFQNDFGGSVEFTPSYDLRVTGRGFYSTYTDTNERVWGQLEMARRVAIKPDILLGARLTAFDFKKVFDNGYWNPDRYQSAEATFQSYGQITDKLSYDVQLAGGWAWTQPGTNGAVYAGTARVNYQFHPDATFSLFANHLTSHVRSGETGGVADEGNDRPFRRNVLGAQLQVRLGTPLGVFAPDPKPAPASALPAFTWTGFYTGVNAGWGFDEDEVRRGRLVTPRPGGGTFAVRPAVPGTSFYTPARVNNDDGGLTGGIQAGYNLQMGMFVAGLEADLQAIDLGDVPGRRLNAGSFYAATRVRPGNPTFGIQPPIFGDPNVFFRGSNILNDEHNIDAFATLRGRVGLAFDRTLVYATGGLAWKTDGSDGGAQAGRPVA